MFTAALFITARHKSTHTLDNCIDTKFQNKQHQHRTEKMRGVIASGVGDEY